MGVMYQVESYPEFGVDQFVRILERSTLGERRPVHAPVILEGMLAHADLIITARIDGELVGLSRAISDFHFCTYLSDLAVDLSHQRRGIGKALVQRTHEEAGLHTTLILLAAPLARDYYGRIGMSRQDSCWVIPRQ